MQRIFFFAGLLFYFITLSAGVAAQVEIQIRDTASSQDDFVCWTPTRARVRLTTSGGADVNVILSSKTASTGTGSVAFAHFSGTPPTRDTYIPQDSLPLTLPASGDWVPFLLSGKTASTLTPTIVDKDAVVEARRVSDNAVVGTNSLMVRVRKDAATLNETERNLFLDALGRLHGHNRAVGPTEKFIKYARAHAGAFSVGIHNGRQGFPLFLAWHRAFLLSLERELQVIDPRVALPYWRFDKPMTSIFTQEFLGQTNVPGVNDPNLVRFSSTNPLRGWFTRVDGELRRTRNGSNPLQTIRAVDIGISAPSSLRLIDELADIFQKTGADLYGGSIPSRGINSRFELRYHNLSHAFISGWLGSGSSPRDPLFFLLHANVDRAWAQWQTRLDRFDRDQIASYPAQGVYPGPGGMSDPSRLPKSSYVNDVMWPWSQDDGSSTGDVGDDWPSAGFVFPTALPGLGPASPPTPGDMIDYMNVLGRNAELGMCYDHIDFFGKVN